MVNTCFVLSADSMPLGDDSESPEKQDAGSMKSSRAPLGADTECFYGTPRDI